MSSYLETNSDSDDEEIITTTEQEKALGKEKASRLKSEGDDHFRLKDYNAALQFYTEAIKCLKSSGLPNDAVLLCNRSATYLLLKRYVPACHDAVQSAKIDPDNWKGTWTL